MQSSTLNIIIYIALQGCEIRVKWIYLVRKKVIASFIHIAIRFIFSLFNVVFILARTLLI
jgi:hypothetical protein